MGWQLPADYAEAFERPPRCFHDPELRRAQVLRDGAGRFHVRPGALADVYEARSLAGPQRWAVKCYRQEVPGLDRHYRALAAHLLATDLPCLAPFEYLDRGLCVRGRWYPALKMHWVNGVPLGTFVGQVADQPDTLRHLARLWVRLLTDLRRAGLAHGLLQHDHVLVGPGTGTDPLMLRLIDYDAVSFPGEGGPPCETGHANFQHPQRLWQHVHDADADHFPALVAYTALLALAEEGPDLWGRHDAGDNLLFREADFQEPATSAVFRELWRGRDAGTRPLVGRLLLAAQGSGRDVPTLRELAAEADTPTDAGESSRFRLSVEQERKAESILGLTGPEGGSRHAPGASRRKTFGVAIETKEDVEVATADDFGLVVDSDADLLVPALVATPCPPPRPPPLPARQAAPPPLPVVPPPLPPDPRIRTYYLEAWMPEQVAVMKVQGFVDAASGEVVLSMPGLMRVRLVDPDDLAAPPRPGLLAWLGLAEAPRPGPRVLAVVDFHMQHKETAFQKLLAITLTFYPGDVPADLAAGRWRAYCDRIYCEVRGFLMGTRAEA